MAASLPTLRAIKSGEIQRNLNDECVELEKRFAELAQEERVSARLLGFGGQLQVYFTDGCLGFPICDLSAPHRVRLRCGLQARSRGSFSQRIAAPTVPGAISVNPPFPEPNSHRPVTEIPRRAVQLVSLDPCFGYDLDLQRIRKLHLHALRLQGLVRLQTHVPR